MTIRCFDCSYGDYEYPCRIKGEFDIAKLANAYLDNVIRDTSGTGKGGDHWSFGCANNLVEKAPGLAWELVLELMPGLATTKDANRLGAGLLEDLVATKGDSVIDEIEHLALASPRFRCVLCSVWPQGKSGSKIWARVKAARPGGAPNPESHASPSLW